MSLHSLIETLRQSAARRSPSGPAMNDASEDELPPLPRPMAVDHPSRRLAHATGETLIDFRPFSSLSVKLRRLLQTRLTPASFAPGDFLLRQGDAGSSLVLLIEGDVEISTRDEQNNRHVIDRSSGGEVLGEMALLTREPRTADAIAITPVRALLLSVDEFHRLAHQHPELPCNDLVGKIQGMQTGSPPASPAVMRPHNRQSWLNLNSGKFKGRECLAKRIRKLGSSAESVVSFARKCLRKRTPQLVVTAQHPQILRKRQKLLGDKRFDK